MVCDFADIKAVWKEIESSLDHQDLNTTLAEAIPVTTAELIAFWICKVFKLHDVPVHSVRVWETATSFAEVNVSEVWSNGF